jgi:hypothetical protein
MKRNAQHSHRNQPKSSSKEFATRAKILAATVAALGATIGVNMGEVLAGSQDLRLSETDKAAISSQQLKKPSVRTPKVERPSLQNRPDVRANKAAPLLQNPPDVRAHKPQLPASPDSERVK